MHLKQIRIMVFGEVWTNTNGMLFAGGGAQHLKCLDYEKERAMKGPECRVFCPAVRYCNNYAANREEHALAVMADFGKTIEAQRITPDFYDQDRDELESEIMQITKMELTEIEVQAQLYYSRADKALARRDELIANCARGVLIESNTNIILCQSEYPGADGFTYEDYLDYQYLLPPPPTNE